MWHIYIYIYIYIHYTTWLVKLDKDTDMNECLQYLNEMNNYKH